MKGLKIIAKIIGKILLLIVILNLTFFVLISFKVKTDLINHSIPKDIVDSTIIHFIHGSIPSPDCVYKKKRIGGYLGGHVEIEIDNKVFGFLYQTTPINFFPKTKVNSKFEVRRKIDWLSYTRNDKITSIVVPITMEQKINLKKILNLHLKNEPYDYAFIGQRCASSTSEILSDAKILNRFSNNEAIIAFFYPRELRFTLIKFAEKNSLTVRVKNGIYCHSWE